MLKRAFWLLLTFALLVACSTPAPTPTSVVPAPPRTPTAPRAALARPSRFPTPTPAPILAPTPTAAGQTTITILHTNDMHGYLEGEILEGGDGTKFEFGGAINAFGTVARLKQDARRNVVTLDAGDFWQGTFASNRDDGKTFVAAMNAVGYDALTLGNHDFDHGLDAIRTRAGEAKFPFLAANLTEESTGKLPAWVKPYLVTEFDGMRLGIIGLANSSVPVISKASNSKGLKFARETETLQKVLPEVKAQSDFIIVLAHQGVDVDQRMAEQVAGIDVIVSGHTHVEQNRPKLIGNTLIVHAGYRARHVGRLELTIERASKKIVNYTRGNEPVPAVSNKAYPPPEALAGFGRLIVEAQDAINRPIGETRTDLIAGRLPDGRTSGEYPLGNLVVDAMLAANQAGDRPADIALYNNAGIRIDIPAGAITYGQLYNVLPFDNVLTAMDLNGAHIKAILEQAASCPRVNILVAGMSFRYDCSQARNNRISNILLRGRPLELNRLYRVQTIDYLSTGGDGQTTFLEGTHLAYGDPAVDVVAAYVTKNSPLNLKVEGRIVEGR